jgi:hypothetical protein
MILYALWVDHLRHTVSSGIRFHHRNGPILGLFHGIEKKIASKLRQYVFFAQDGRQLIQGVTGG